MAKAEETGSRQVRSASRSRTSAVLVRLHPEEHALLRTAARQAGVSVPRFMTQAALGGRSNPVEYAQRTELLGEILQLRRLLANVANNVNQIARAYNSGDQQEQQLQAALGSLRGIVDRAAVVVDEAARS